MQARILGQPVGNDVNAAFMLAPVDDAAALRCGQHVEFSQQRAVQRRRAVREQVHKHRTAGGDFARLKRARALVAFQAEKLKPVGKGHSAFIVMPVVVS
jgi:hypothetical protein